MRKVLLALWLLLAFAAAAAAEERILNFVSDVTVNKDASLTVREAITVQAEGDDIKRGIIRDFPTVYRDHLGQRVRVGFDLIEVKRDGRPEPYSVSAVSNGRSIKIGEAEVFLEHGSHTYEITYKTTRQIGFFDSFDELYWNVTGNGWTFPIDQASVTVRLPLGARILQHHEYTGAAGSTANASTVDASSGSEYRARTTQRLEPGEGFTVAVAWPKGVIAAPTDSERASWWLRDNLGIFALIASIILTGLYYIYAWDKVGRDPPAGVIMPLFKPPEGLGAAGTRFVWKQGFDDQGFAAALVGLAVKGRLKIIDDDGGYAIEKKANAGPALTKSEQQLYASLGSGVTELKQANHATIRALRGALQKSLSAEYDGTLFIRNLPWFWKGAVISVAGLAASALLMPIEEGAVGLFTVAWSGIWWGAILTAIWAAFGKFGAKRGFLNKIGSILGMLFLIPFIFGGVAAPIALLTSAGSPGLYLLIAAAVIHGIMNLVFFYLLRAPTLPGRRILDQIEGFRMYMTTAEEDRLNVLNPPEKTPELFERYLPYAMALDCENEWNEKFAAVLAAAAMAGAAAPTWYSGSHWGSGGFTDSLGPSLSSTISSASTATGSRSGSGGGGSSGGGGGGGGGSGW